MFSFFGVKPRILGLGSGLSQAMGSLGRRERQLGWKHFLGVSGALITAAVVLSACSTAPQYTYVADTGDNAYFKVPPGGS